MTDAFMNVIGLTVVLHDVPSHVKGGHLGQMYTNLTVAVTEVAPPIKTVSDHREIMVTLKFTKGQNDQAIGSQQERVNQT